MKFISEALLTANKPLMLKAALEAQGITDSSEQEIVIYAKIGNMEGLSQASLIEQHEQAEIKSEAGRIRVRKTTRNGRVPVYEMTSKRPISVGGVKSNREKTKSINEQLYNLFLEVCPSFMAKTRYVFKTENLRIKRGDMQANIKTSELNFEVDVFTKGDGTVSKWCKIDIEVDKIEEILKKNSIEVGDMRLIASISSLPFEPDTIVIDDGNDDEGKKELISALYENEFLIQRSA